MTFDGELHIGAVDGTTPVVKEFRKSLWAEHLARGAAGLDDPVTAFTTFASDTAASSGRVRPYDADPPGTPAPRLHSFMIGRVDPYGGPPR
jgi:hypothetical protein